MKNKPISKLELTDPRIMSTILEAADDAIVIAAASDAPDGALRIVYANEAYTRMTGFKLEDLLGRVPRSADEWKFDPVQSARIKAGMAAHQPMREDLLVKRKDGSPLWIDFSLRPLFNAQRKLTHWISVQRDITEHKTALDALARHAHALEETQTLAKIGSWRWQVGADGIDCSAETCAMVGMPRVQSFVPFAALKTVTDPKDFRVIHTVLQNTVVFERSETFEYPIKTAQAGTRTIWARTYPERDGNGRIVAVSGLNQDVTDRLRVEQTLRWNATHDRLTGLLNMAALHERAATVLATAKADRSRVVLALIDLDHLKLVNDTLGHAVGDAMIKEAASRLLEMLGAYGYVARLGGDEYVFLGSWKKSREELDEQLRAVVQRLKQPFAYQGRQLDCAASIGAVMSQPRTAKIDTLLRNADMAMYRAKETGRGSFCFFSNDMQETVDRRLAQSDLAKLVVASKLAVPYFQPQYSLQQDRVVGYEALLRIAVGDRLLLPEAVECAFENAELATKLGDEMLRKVLEQMRHWRQQGFAFGRIAINASGMELLSAGYAQRVLDALHRAGVSPADLEIEVTENVLIGRGAERLIETLQLLRSAGVSVALDDFGTGYASLIHLKALPINRIKIDKSFVRDITLDREDAAIVSATVGLAHALSLDVVAEGVETHDQAAFLRNCGCDVVQGYLFGHPLAAETIDGAIASGEDSAVTAKAQRRAS
ncbi:EAL domain-containing protein [Novosphingobium sp.]|uniref:putative bifunctional diguanylate cyclase/phosphodiesterase n=1 Tax=Novosphingobium sp. TaxID=1874826 RepID=UPI002617441A|nr:EAL domain-containing protein [Novosphingobium sp.]